MPSEMLANVIAATVGAIALQLTLKVINRRSDKLQEHLSLRKELREELDAVRAQMTQLQEEVSSWKDKYYEQLLITNQLKLDVEKLTSELEEYKTNSGVYTTVEHP